MAGGWIDVLAPLATSILLLVVLRPGLAFQGSIPAGTDFTGHLLTQEVMGSDFLPAGRIRGWAPEWFTGFPLFWFYFPFPATLGAVLGKVVGPPLALRIVALTPSLALPWVIWGFARWSGLPRAARWGAVMGGSTFLFMTSYYALGGNLLSTFAGEFSYAWGLTLSLLYLGLVARSGRGKGRGYLAGAVLGAAFLSHLLPAAAAAAASGVALFDPKRRSPTLVSWAVTGAIAGFWLVPLVVRFGHVGEVGWEYAPGFADLLPMEVLFLVPAALVGFVHFWRHPGVRLLAAAALIGVLVAAVPQPYVMRGRLLPVWFLTIHLIGGAGIGTAIGNWIRGRREAPVASPGEARPGRRSLITGAIAALALAPWLVVLSKRSAEPITGLRDFVLAGLDSVPGAADFAALRNRLVSLPPGRLHWEDHESLGEWGGPYAFAILPRSTPHTSLGGLLAESSPISRFTRTIDWTITRAPQPRPYRAPSPDVTHDPARGVEWLRLMGVRYFVTVSAEGATDLEGVTGTRVVDRFGDLTLFDLGERSLVVPIPCRIEFSRMAPSFGEASAEWFEEWTARAPFLTPHPDPARAGSETCSTSVGSTAEVLRSERHLLRFRAARRGVPHLIRMGYFPNWKAEGALGPYRVTPDFMVVIPQSEIVTLWFGITTAEIAGWATSFAFAAFVLLLWGESGVPLPGSGRRSRNGDGTA